jgi:peptidyl-dipeptidase A
MQKLKPLSILLMLSVAIALTVSCTGGFQNEASKSKPTEKEAEKFIADTEQLLQDLSLRASRASWVQSNFITDDTEAISAQANQDFIEATTKLATDVKRFDGMKLTPVLERKFKLLKLSLFSLSDPKERQEVATLGTGLEAEYGKGKACPGSGKHAGKCLPIGEVEQVLAKSRDPEEMRGIWEAWHAVGAPMRQRYTRFIEL